MPHPRGEIVATSGRLTPGYYNNPAANKQAFVTIGGRRHFRTGDVGMLVDGKLKVHIRAFSSSSSLLASIIFYFKFLCVSVLNAVCSFPLYADVFHSYNCICNIRTPKVIDRKSAMFKLANGLFVAPAPLEALFEESPFIKQALVCAGAGARGVYIVAVLTDAGAEACSGTSDGGAVGGSGSGSGSGGGSNAKAFNPSPVLQACAQLAANDGRKGHEMPYCAVLTTEEWTVDNGCLTSNLKICRPALLRKFNPPKQNLAFCSGGKPTTDAAATIAAATTSASSKDTKVYNKSNGNALSSGLVQVLRETVPPLESPDVALPSGEQTLYGLGADSLTLAVVRTTLQSRFGLSIPLVKLAGATLWDLNAAMLGGGVESLPDDDDGPEALRVEADAVRNEWSTRSSTGGGSGGSGGDTAGGYAATDAGSCLESKTTVFLTGVTGFVGAFLLHELLDRDPSVHVICMARAEDDAAASVRVRSTLYQYHLVCDCTRWTAVAGDLAAPEIKGRLGMREETWGWLEQSIDVRAHTRTRTRTRTHI